MSGQNFRIPQYPHLHLVIENMEDCLKKEFRKRRTRLIALDRVSHVDIMENMSCSSQRQWKHM